MQNINRTAIAITLFLLTIFIGCGKEKTNGDPAPSDSSVVIPPPPNSNLPDIKGELVYHSYVNYGDESKMYIYDFSKKQLSCISCNWNIHDPMNAHFSPDGTKIVFMGQAVPNGKWDIYIWTIGSPGAPANLTAGDRSRDEDPKFSPDGKSICFKQTTSQSTGNLKIMDLNGTIINNVTNNTIESGVPYYLFNSAALIYARGAGAASDIYKVNMNSSNNRAIEKENNLQEYYPIVVDSNTYLFSRWYSTSNHNDQVYLGYFLGTPSISLPFNTPNANYSDAYPCGTDYVFLSSTRAGTVGAYDLYIAHLKTGAIWTLTSFQQNVNTSVNELGACYWGD